MRFIGVLKRYAAVLCVNPDYLLLQGEQARHLASVLRHIATEIEAGEHADTALYHIDPWRPPSRPRREVEPATNGFCGIP